MMPLVIPDFSKIDEYMILVGAQFHIQPFLAQFLAVTNVLQAGRIVPENAEIGLIIVQSKTFS